MNKLLLCLQSDLLYNSDRTDIKNEILADIKYYSLNHIILSYNLNLIKLEVVVGHNTVSIRLSYFSKLSHFFTNLLNLITLTATKLKLLGNKLSISTSVYIENIEGENITTRVDEHCLWCILFTR